MKLSTYLKLTVMPWRARKLLREEQEELARHGAVPVPGEATLVLPAGKVRVSYRESIKARSSGDSIDFGWPASLEVSVRPLSGGEPLELRTGWGEDTTAIGGKQPQTTTRVGTIEVSQAGEYAVSVTADVADRTEPTVLFG